MTGFLEDGFGSVAGSAEDGDDRGWVVTNADGTQWRVWRNGASHWTDRPRQATRYPSRQEAEAAHAGDLSVWFQPFADALARQRRTSHNPKEF